MTTKTAWADLPNARHIDAVLASVKARPEVWAAAWDAVRDATRGTARTAVRYAVRGAAREAAWRAVWHAVRGTARTAVWDAARGTSRVTARDAIRALIAWDSSADLLDLPPDVLRTMADLAPEPVNHQAALLLPYAIVKTTAIEEIEQ